MNLTTLPRCNTTQPALVSYRRTVDHNRPILFGQQMDHESLIRRALFHLGEEPWPDPDVPHGAHQDKTPTESRENAALSYKKREAFSKLTAAMEMLLKTTFYPVLNNLKRVIHEREKPTLIVAGGTIDTEPDPSTGTRIPNHARQKQRLQSVLEKTHRQITPFYPNVPDSSNIDPALQQKLMESILTEVEQNLASMPSLAPSCFRGLKEKTKRTSIPVDEIPKYFDTPRKWGRGIYVTHGSDTLAIDAALAAYLFRDAHLVSVWTGAWNSRNEPGFDGALNEKRARRLAKHPYTPPGAYVVIGDQIHLAAKAMKINNHPFSPKEINPALGLPYASGSDQMVSYFASLGDQSVGYFDQANQPHFYARFLREQEKRAERGGISPSPAALTHRYHREGALRPAYVEHVIINRETPSAVFDDLCTRLRKKGTYSGAIIEGPLGERQDWPKLREEIQALRNENIYILPAGQNLTPYQAQLKLSALLSEKNASIEETMKRDLLGENVPMAVAKREQIPFPKGFFKHHEWIQGSPALGSEVIQDATRRLLQREVEDPILVINGTGDGHIPIGALTMEQRLKEGYLKMGHPQKLQRLQQAMRQLNLDYSPTNIEKALVNVYSHNGRYAATDQVRQMARDELKHVLRQSDPMLEAIGEALDKGIQVKMGTQVAFAKPNLSTYEIGSILKFIGVQEYPQKLTSDRFPSKL